MSKIETSKWKEFALTELFNLVLAKGDLQPKKLEKGDMPLVSAGNFNNGIATYIDKNGDGISERFKANCITVDMFGKAFYQNADFYAVSHGRVNILLPKFKLNKNIGLFLSSVLDRKLSSIYGFAKMCSQSKLKFETVLLPADKNGNPDWTYMESVVKSERAKMQKLVDIYNAVRAKNLAGGGQTAFKFE